MKKNIITVIHAIAPNRGNSIRAREKLPSNQESAALNKNGPHIDEKNVYKPKTLKFCA